MRPRSTSGQAAVEYIAVVALVAIVFAVAGGFVLNGRAIAAATVAQIKRGLCIVEGHDCPERHAECSVSSQRKSDELSADILVVRLGAGSSVIVDHKSNGKVVVTLADHLDAGGGVGFGGDLKLGDKLSLGAEARAAIIASLGHGTSYEVADDRQAEALIRLLRRPKIDPNFYTPADKAYWARIEAALPRIPAPVSRYRELSLTASGSVKAGPLASLAGMLGGGGREDLITHNRTYYLKGSLALDVDAAGAELAGSAEGKAAITFDRDGNPLDLMLLGAGRASASADLPMSMQSIAGDLKVGAGRTWKLEGHLDLTQPGRMQAVLDSLTHPSRLVRMVLDEGTVEADTYGTHKESFGLSGHVKDGLSVGGGFSHDTESSHLLSAMEHTPEGFWVPRYDCLPTA